jgi:hypothetical protein
VRPRGFIQPPLSYTPKNDEERALIERFVAIGKVIYRRWTDKVKRGVPNATFVDVPGAGHYLWLTREARSCARPTRSSPDCFPQGEVESDEFRRRIACSFVPRNGGLLTTKSTAGHAGSPAGVSPSHTRDIVRNGPNTWIRLSGDACVRLRFFRFLAPSPVEEMLR